MDGLSVSTENPGPNLTIRGFGVESVKIIKGQKEPVVQGWLPDRSAGYGGIRPIPTAMFSSVGKGKLTMLYALWPTLKDPACPVEDLKLSGNELVARMTGGEERRVKFQQLQTAGSKN